MNESVLHRIARSAIRYGSYPMLLGLTLAYLHLELSGGLSRPLGSHYPAYLAVTIGLMLLLEWSAPMRSEWAMTWRSFLRRDLPLAVTNGTAMAVTTLGLTALAQHLGAPHWHLAASVPWWAGALIAIALSDFLWYWLHRMSHETGGRLGDWLWRMHVVHHLPEQVYVLMHPVSHPINSILVRAILMLPGLALGLSPAAVFAAGVFTSFQGLVSHFNVDSRVGWLNYLLIGTELHREHHSAKPSEALNYGAVISLWDLLFGTFRYRPGRSPAALGVEAPDRYPKDHEWLKLMALPLRW